VEIEALRSRRLGADGERVKIVRGSTTTVYLEGLCEEVAGGAAKAYYTLNGQVVAVRDRSTSAVTYLHGDHIGSVSVATTSGCTLASQQDYTSFGSYRGSGDIASQARSRQPLGAQRLYTSPAALARPRTAP
jgi:hypothetical protein